MCDSKCLTSLFRRVTYTLDSNDVVMNPVIYVTLSIKQPYNIPVRPIPMVSLTCICVRFFSVIVYEFKETFRVFRCMCRVRVGGRFDENDSIRFSPSDQKPFHLMYIHGTIGRIGNEERGSGNWREFERATRENVDTVFLLMLMLLLLFASVSSLYFLQWANKMFSALCKYKRFIRAGIAATSSIYSESGYYFVFYLNPFGFVCSSYFSSIFLPCRKTHTRMSSRWKKSQLKHILLGHRKKAPENTKYRKGKKCDRISSFPIFHWIFGLCAFHIYLIICIITMLQYLHTSHSVSSHSGRYVKQKRAYKHWAREKQWLMFAQSVRLRARVILPQHPVS